MKICRVNHPYLTAIKRTNFSVPATYVLKHDSFKGCVLDYGCGFGFDTGELKRQGYDVTELEKDMTTGVFLEPITRHNVYDEKGGVVDECDFNENQAESEGTKKIIEMSGPIFDTLNEGKTLIVYELDAKLHPLLTRNIVLLFMDPVKNSHGAQLIFATHDTNLLDLEIVRRDQIWFAEKDKVEATDIYSLVEFKDEEGKKVRNDRDIRRDYIRGRYGAILFIGK